MRSVHWQEAFELRRRAIPSDYNRPEIVDWLRETAFEQNSGVADLGHVHRSVLFANLPCMTEALYAQHIGDGHKLLDLQYVHRMRVRTRTVEQALNP